MIELALALVDRCISLVRERDAQREALYRDFIVPAIADLDAVHGAYLARFARYRDMLQESTDLSDAHPIFDAIEKDSLYTAESRAKVSVLKSLSDDEQLGPFLRAVHDYVIEPTSIRERLQEAATSRRVLRTNWYGALADQQLLGIARSPLAGQMKAVRARMALDEIVRELQDRYGVVLQAEMELKRQLTGRKAGLPTKTA